MRLKLDATSALQKLRALVSEYQGMRTSFQATFRIWPLAIFWDFLARTRLALVWSRLQSTLSIPLRLRNGCRLYARPFTIDEVVIREVWSDEVYSPRMIRDLARGGLVIDIGAHIGIFALFAISTGLATRVLCYEPFLANFRLLNKNIKENNLAGVQAFPLAVLDRRGNDVLYSRDSTNTGGHSFFLEGAASTVVKTITLEDVFASNNVERCELLKIDAEGSEYRILMGAPRSVLQRVNSIALEYHVFGERDRHRLENLRNFLDQNGFSVSVRPNRTLKGGILYAIRDEDNRGVLHPEQSPPVVARPRGPSDKTPATLD